MDERRRMVVVTRVAAASLVSTSVVVAVKLAAVALSGSISVLAESLNSLLDVALGGIALWTLKKAAEPPDEDHPFGHAKAELLLSAFQMILVILASAAIAWQAALHLHEPRPIKADWGLAAMAYSVVANSIAVIALRRTGQNEASDALLGEAEHLRGDTLASLGVIVGLLLTKLTGWSVLDPVVAIVFTLAGAGFAVRQLLRVLHPLMDGALPAGEVRAIEQALEAHEAVKGYHKLLTRQAGPMRIVSLHVLLDDQLSFVEAHDLAEQVEEAVSGILHGASVTVHYEPYESEMAHQAQFHSSPRT